MFNSNFFTLRATEHMPIRHHLTCQMCDGEQMIYACDQFITGHGYIFDLDFTPDQCGSTPSYESIFFLASLSILLRKEKRMHQKGLILVINCKFKKFTDFVEKANPLLIHWGLE